MADAVMIRYPKICNAIGHNSQFGGTASVHTKCERCKKVLATQHDWATSSLVEPPQFECEDDWVYMSERCNCGYVAQSETDADISTLTTSTCSTLGTYIHNITVDGTTYTCGETHVVSSLNPSIHEGSATFGGTAEVHTKYSCCGVTISSEHDLEDSWTLVSVNWDCNNGSMSRIRSCSCSYQRKDRPTSINPVTTDPATCTSYSKYYHNAVFKDGSSYRCDSNHQGNTLDPSNHTGSSVYGGTSSVHTKWSCCGVTISSEHTLSASSGKFNCDTPEYLLTSSCTCGYAETSSINCVTETTTAGTCTTPETFRHGATLPNGRTFYCSQSHQGNKDPQKHTGSEFYVGVENVHSCWSCCQAVYSTTHDDWDSSLYSCEFSDDCVDATFSQKCSCGYTIESQVETAGLMTKTPTCISTGSYIHTAEGPNGTQHTCGQSHSAPINTANHVNITWAYHSNRTTGHSYWATCTDCTALVEKIPASGYDPHTYDDLSSVSSTCHIGKCTVCGYAAYQEHYAPNRAGSMGVASEETWCCAGCGYDTGKAILSTGDSLNGYTSPFDDKFPPEWTHT